MIREILNTKKVREKSGNFLILAQNCLIFAGILSICSYWKPCNFFFLTRFAQTAFLQVNVHFRDCLLKNFKIFYFLIEQLGLYILFNALKMELIFYQFQDEEKSVKFSAVWSWKNRIWSGKSQWEVREFCLWLRMATLLFGWRKKKKKTPCQELC